MNQSKWIAYGYEHPQKWAFKKDMPTHLQHEGVRLDFGLFGLAWVARDQNGEVLMKSGGRLQTFEFYLTTPGRVIGPRDARSAEHTNFAREWSHACVDKRTDQITEKINL